MTIETDLFTVLKVAAPGLQDGTSWRIFPDFAPVDTARPYITYQQIGGDALTFVGREVPSKQNALYQINVWAGDRKSARALALAIESALTLTTNFQAKPEGAAVSDYDADIPVYGCRQDFSIWADR